MANRSFKPGAVTLEPGLVKLQCHISIGASGAPTLARNKGKAFASVAKNGTGDYTLTLIDKFKELVAWDIKIEKSSGFPVAPHIHLISEDVGASTPVIRFQMGKATSAGDTTLVAGEPASGEVLRCEFTLSNSTAA